jgi:AraC-like DNA-binding protein
MILLDFKLLESLLPFFPKNNVPEKKPSALFSHPVQIDEKLMRILIKLLTSVTLPAPFFSQTPSYLLDLYQYVLNSPLGYILKYAVASKVADISRSIDYLKLRFNQDIAVSELAKVAEMPLTTFHRHFKWQTGMSPLQYLKSVRLIEARRLMLFYGKTAVNSSKDVGYTSSTQFTREYKRIFYKPPRQDMHYTLRYNAPIYQPLSLTHDYDPEIQDE